MSGVVLHLDLGADAPSTDLIHQVQHVLALLQHHDLPVIVLAECSSIVTASAAVALQPSGGPHTRCVLVQPSQAVLSLAAVLSRLALPPADVVLASISLSPSLYQAALAANTCAFQCSPHDASWTAALLQRIATMANRSSALRVGYLMKPQREGALHNQGMLSLMPIYGVSFFPLTVLVPLEAQPPVDIVLHKISDHLVMPPLDAAPPPGSSAVLPTITPEAQTLLEAALRQGAVVLDPLARVSHVLDRVLMAAAVETACAAVRTQAVPAGSPPWIQVTSFGPEVMRAMRASGVDFPVVVKPRAACGTPDAHLMAFVLAGDAFQELEVPLPAIVQAYSDHGGVVWKVYVAGDRVFIVQKASTPDLGPLVARLAADPDGDVPTSIHFDSLQSLPTALPRSLQCEKLTEEQGEARDRAQALLRPQYLEAMAAALRAVLQLTLFGFDVVFDTVAGEARIVDVNYFPSFRGIEGAPAAFREALKAAHAAHGQPLT